MFGSVLEHINAGENVTQDNFLENVIRTCF
jgi:hypothetical protein